MSYEPTVWNVGDTIAVAKLNRLEQGVAEMSSGYTPTVWVDGDEITAQKMNRLEQAVASGSSGGSSDFSTAEVTVTYQSMQDATLLLAHITSANGVEPLIQEEAGEGGKTVVYNVPLYMSKALCVASDGAENLQGSIVDNEDGTYTITGNCSFTASLARY